MRKTDATMKKTILYFFLMFGFAVSIATAAPKTLAVLYFENNSLDKAAEMQPLSKGLADMFITEFSKIEQFRVVERSRIEQLIEEMKLGQSGLIKPESAQQVGNMLGAQNLVFGSFMRGFDGKMRIDIRIVEVETGLTLKAEQETGNPKDLYKVVNKLVAKVIKNLDIRISKAEAKKLAQVENTSFDASLLYAKGLEYEDNGDFKNAKKMYEKALKKNKNYTSAQARLKALAKY